VLDRGPAAPGSFGRARLTRWAARCSRRRIDRRELWLPYPARVRNGLAVLKAAALLARLLLLLLTAWPDSAVAHGISGRASLPVPAWLFAWSAAIVLVVSFVALSALWSSPRLQHQRLRRLGPVPVSATPVCGLIGLALFAVVIYAGYEGVSSYTANFDPTFVYVIFWVGVPLASGLLGDLFRAFSPWRATARTIGWIFRRTGLRYRPPLAYPDWLGRWPVVAGLLAFGWLELIYHGRDSPSLLASLSLAYFVLMLVGMALFGIETWSEHGDAFGGYFNMLSRLSILEVRERALYLRRPLSALAEFRIEPGAVAMVLTSIGIVTFDGASNGVVWNTLGPHIQSFFASLGVRGGAADELSDSVGMLIALGAVTGFYYVGVYGMRSVWSRYGAGELSRTFVHSLIPIAFAYVLAHYFSLFVWQGQAIGYLASNPLGEHSNLFGTAHWHINYNFIDSTAIWYVQVAALVIGHVSGLTLAHDRALGMYRETADAVRSQYWMLAVMVTFTCLGLWLLSAVNT
jgi:hypothetical protein